MISVCFLFNDTATSEIYTLSLHDALPICYRRLRPPSPRAQEVRSAFCSREVARKANASFFGRSEEHTSELQSRFDLVCRLLLEKKKNNEYLLSELTSCISLPSFTVSSNTP